MAMMAVTLSFSQNKQRNCNRSTQLLCENVQQGLSADWVTSSVIVERQMRTSVLANKQPSVALKESGQHVS
jgi:hypothetical protein